MTRIISRDGVTYCRADQIIVGDALDLEGDMITDPDTYADPDNGEPSRFEFELSEVHEIEFEAHDLEPVIVLHTSDGSFGFPIDHEIQIERWAD